MLVRLEGHNDKNAISRRTRNPHPPTENNFIAIKKALKSA